jgi:hypothetical protein
MTTETALTPHLDRLTTALDRFSAVLERHAAVLERREMAERQADEAQRRAREEAEREAFKQRDKQRDANVVSLDDVIARLSTDRASYASYLAEQLGTSTRRVRDQLNRGVELGVIATVPGRREGTTGYVRNDNDE